MRRELRAPKGAETLTYSFHFRRRRGYPKGRTSFRKRSITADRDRMATAVVGAIDQHAGDAHLARFFAGARSGSDRGYDGFGIRAVSAILNAQIKAGVPRFDTGQ